MNHYLIAEFVDNIQEIIKQPIYLTQRIKYTCCDVSKEYIVFGASSGGLYLFHRHPCSFDKLIPSTEGPVSHVSISPDEKIFSFATTKGTICLVEVSSKNTDIQVYNEHIGNTITVMKWNVQSEELFVGDNTGKVSVVINASFITKTMFQTPCFPLLQLDSHIVQIDACSNFLLVSTLTRCYLCDTEKEQYRQIGHKLRDGEFGACFFGANTLSFSSPRQEQIGSFRILEDKESFNTLGLEKLRIFCARPGLRLWEVQIDGTVVRTHQFKQALMTEPNKVISIKETDCRLELNTRNSSPSVTFNFVKLYVLSNNFILTFKRDGIYILDPVNGRVVLWINKYSNILDIRIIKNYIYVLTQKYKIHILLFSNLEAFILKCLFNKKYVFCADLCSFYSKQILSLLSSPNKLHLLSILDEKLLEKNELEIREKILPVLSTITEHSEKRKTAQKMNNGIFVIDNAHFVNNTISEVAGTSQISFSNFENSDKVEVDDRSEPDNKLAIARIYEQYEVDKAIGTYNSKVLVDILNNCSNENICNIFMKLEEYAISLQCDKTDIRLWCFEKCLQYITKHKDYVLLIFNLPLSEGLGAYVKQGFQTLNSSFEDSCLCTYPLPKASTRIPKFLHIGCCLLQKFAHAKEIYTQFCSEVPFMWGELLKLQQSSDLSPLLSLIIQYNKEEIVDIFLKKFTYDHWHEALKYFILLKSGKCLKCEKSFSDDSGMSWTNFTMKMLNSIGAESSMELLQQYSDNIPPAVLKEDFYQAAIFSSVVENFNSTLRKDSIEFVKKMHGSNLRGDFEKLLEKTLQKSASNSVYNKTVNSKVEENCQGCHMSLQTPVLLQEKLVFLQCGHSFHNICYNHEKNSCNICNSK